MEKNCSLWRAPAPENRPSRRTTPSPPASSKRAALATGTSGMLRTLGVCCCISATCCAKRSGTPAAMHSGGIMLHGCAERATRATYRRLRDARWKLPTVAEVRRAHPRIPADRRLPTPFAAASIGRLTGRPRSGTLAGRPALRRSARNPPIDRHRGRRDSPDALSPSEPDSHSPAGAPGRRRP